MIKICFVCLGNICRSPMAEYIMKDMIQTMKLVDKFYITSRATSYEEEGNSIYYLAKDILDKNNIKYSEHYAKRLEKSDYERFDYFICMDDSNVYSTLKIFGKTSSNKVIKLLNRDVKDPWYTRNFQETYNDIVEGIFDLLNQFKK